MIDSREVTHVLFLFSIGLFTFSRVTFLNGRDSVMFFTEKSLSFS